MQKYLWKIQKISVKYTKKPIKNTKIHKTHLEKYKNIWKIHVKKNLLSRYPTPNLKQSFTRLDHVSSMVDTWMTMTWTSCPNAIRTHWISQLSTGSDRSPSHAFPRAFIAFQNRLLRWPPSRRCADGCSPPRRIFLRYAPYFMNFIGFSSIF